MCSSPKDRGVKHTHYKHLHSINGDMAGEEHHYKELAEAAIERREAMKKLERRYNKRHPKKPEKHWLAKFFDWFHSS